MANPICKRCRRSYVTTYVHYLTGEVMDCRDYGYKAWPFGPCRCGHTKRRG
jgi:hypothetical protein